MLNNLASKINVFSQIILLKYLLIRYTSMLFESRIVFELLAVQIFRHQQLLKSNVLLTTIYSFIKHLRMI